MLPFIFLCLGIIIGFYCKVEGWLEIFGWFTIFFLCIAIASGLVGKKKKIKRTYFIWVLIGLLLFSVQSAKMCQADELLEKRVEIFGICKKVNVDEEKEKVTLVIATKSIREDATKQEAEPFAFANGTLKIQAQYYKELKNPDELIGKKISAYGILDQATQRRNPKCFDYRLYLKSVGISYVLKTDAILLDESKNEYASFWNFLLAKAGSCKKSFINSIKQRLDMDNAGLLRAMMFGSKEDMSDETYQEFQRNGTAHILAVSGIHMGIIYGLISKVFAARRNRIKNIFIMLFLFFYAMMAEFTPSITRAFLMICTSIFARLLNKRYDLLSGGFLAAMILLFINPFVLFNSGFQMSFLAIFVIAVSLNKLEEVDIKKFYKNTLIPVIIIQGAMSMYTAYNFNYFSLTSFIANIPVIFIASLLMPLGIICLVINIICGEIFMPCAKVLELAVQILKKSNSYTYINGAGTFDVVSPSIFAVVLFYALFFMLTNDEMRILFIRKKFKAVLSIFCIAIVFCTFISIESDDGFADTDMIFIDVGQGSCMLFKGEDGKNILIDGGGNPDYDVGLKTLKPAFLKNGVKKIDIAIATHLDNDHYLGIKSLANEGMIDKIAFYAGNSIEKEKLARQCGVSADDLLFLKRGDEFSFGGDIKIEVITPDGKSKSEYKSEKKNTDENERSLVLKVYKEDVSFLVTGDIGKITEQKLKGNLKADILQVAHHGSKGSSSDEFIERVNPKIAVFQAGKNNKYGHPAPEVIEKYQNKCIIIERSDLQGAIGFRIDGDKFEVVTTVKT